MRSDLPWRSLVHLGLDLAFGLLISLGAFSALGEFLFEVRTTDPQVERTSLPSHVIPCSLYSLMGVEYTEFPRVLGEAMTRERLDVMKGTLILLVLRALEEGPRHGHQIMGWIRERADGAFRIEEGAIYPTLHRLKAKKLIRSEWGVSENNRKAKYYQLTAKGEERLRKEKTTWRQYVEAVADVIGP